MIARFVFALALLAPALTRAEYDWYSEQEGSQSRPQPEGDDGYVDPGGYASGSGTRPRASGEGLALGLRFAYAHPLGEDVKGSDLDDVVKGVLKGQLDLDYGLDPHVVVGVYFAAGGGLLANSVKRLCEMTVAGVSIDANCKLLSLEAGLQAAYRFLPHRLINPWLGANVGMEWLRLTMEAQGFEGVIANLGIAFGPSVGADVQLGDFAFGPYFSAQFAQYMRAKFKLDVPVGLDDEDDGNQSGKIKRRAFHYWLNFGIRARYQF